MTQTYTELDCDCKLRYRHSIHSHTEHMDKCVLIQQDLNMHFDKRDKRSTLSRERVPHFLCLNIPFNTFHLIQNIRFRILT